MEKYAVIAKRILEMADLDQKTRKKPEVTEEEMFTVDRENRNEMKKIIGEYGLISISKFGKDASYMAWLLVQHFPREDVEFMKNYLKLMKDNFNDVDKRNTAYLEDRIDLYEYNPQTYGTQTVSIEGQLHFHKLKKVEGIDELRKSIGLGTLVEYSQMFNSSVILPEGYKE